MKKYLVPILFLLISFNAFSQNNNQLFGMLNNSFIEYVKVQKECYNKQMQARGIEESIPVKFDEIYIAMENYPLGFEFASDIKDLGFKYIYLQGNDAKKILKKTKTVVFMAGPYIENNTLTITFSTRSVILKSNNLDIRVSDSVKCIWQYSCEIGKWRLISVNSAGI